MAAPRPLLSIVVPAFNEALRLPRSLDVLEEYVSNAPLGVEVLIVDDGSTDGTVGVVEARVQGMPWLRLVRGPHRGKGAAVRAGMLAARGASRLIADADLSMPVHEISRFLAALDEGSDVVVGSREGPGALRVGEPYTRHVMGRLFNGAARLLGLAEISDTQCGFKAFTADAAQQIFSRTTVQRFAFDLEVLSMAYAMGYKVRAIPIEWHYNADSRVRPFVDSMQMLGDMVRLRWRRGFATSARVRAMGATAVEAAIPDTTWS